MVLDVKLLNEQLKNITATRDQSLHSYHQCIGAIALLNEQLKILLESLSCTENNNDLDPNLLEV